MGETCYNDGSRRHRRPGANRIDREELDSMKEAIHTDRAPAAIGPYSQAVRAGGFLFTSGQIPVDPAAGDIRRASRPRPNSL